jgi:hypothetical protein
MEIVREEPNDKQLRYFTYLAWRRTGKPIEKLAAEYELGSPAALYHELRRDGFPVCAVCGGYSRDASHCGGSPKERQRRARSGAGEAEELPATAQAIPLFERVIKKLGDELSDLKFRKEYIKDERFVAMQVYPSDTGRVKLGYSNEQAKTSKDAWEEWERLCAKYGKDPITTEEFITAVDSYWVKGASPSPPDPLTNLIAMYVLADRPLGPLLERLHPAPERVDRDQLKGLVHGKKVGNGYVPGIKDKARSIARLVRGGNLRTGRSTGNVSSDEQGAAYRIQALRRQGATEAEIFTDEELREVHGLDREEISRLSKLNLPYPYLDFPSN